MGVSFVRGNGTGPASVLAPLATGATGAVPSGAAVPASVTPMHPRAGVHVPPQLVPRDTTTLTFEGLPSSVMGFPILTWKTLSLPWVTEVIPIPSVFGYDDSTTTTSSTTSTTTKCTEVEKRQVGGPVTATINGCEL